MSIPYIGFGNDTLAGLPDLKAGDTITCPRCNEKHVVEGSKPPMLLFVRCGEDSFMVGLNGKNTTGIPADVKGKI